MNEIKSFTVYKEYFKLINTLKPIEKRDRFIGKIFDFYFRDINPIFEINSDEEAIWENISKPIIRYKQKAINGIKGGRPSIKTETKTETKMETKMETKTETQMESTSNDVIVNVNSNSKKDNRGMGKEEKKEEDKKIHFAEFVTMTNAQYDKLISTHGKKFADQCIKTLDNYKGSKGKTYKDDYRAILSWVVDKVKEKHLPTSTVPIWFDKQIDNELMTEEEQRDLDNLLRDFG